LQIFKKPGIESALTHL